MNRINRMEELFLPDPPRRRIDYILCNQPVRVTDARVINTLVSDHLPLLVAVQFEE
jgi:endonuclease/exonuclease/phosphatase family metal-dependent hydrolase